MPADGVAAENIIEPSMGIMDSKPDVTVEAAGAHFGQLTEHYVLGDAFHGVDFAVKGGVEQHVHCFLERTAHQTANFLAVDTVTRYRHKVALGGHDVAQERQVTIVDVRAVK
ncbi:hypothetical protein BpHYR1_033066 [Brachionus plicatilis]|uniref:Uncharacterized protein n=1 Tax=Brachionus plicatilis TaxID=10195 RepID=A0A3M7RIP7_BRAPC|nr:hypothetical protein BpHYR1_033066 [Brachionus plicatilis]